MVKCDSKRNWNKSSCKKAVGEAEFRMIVPNNDNSKKPINRYTLIKYQDKLNKIFGGSTVITKTQGCYIPEGSKTQSCENNHILIGIRDFDNPYNKKNMTKYNSNQRQKQ